MQRSKIAKRAREEILNLKPIINRKLTVKYSSHEQIIVYNYRRSRADLIGPNILNNSE